MPSELAKRIREKASSSIVTLEINDPAELRELEAEINALLAPLIDENNQMKQSMYQCELLRVMKENEKLQAEAKAFRDALDVQLKLGKELIAERDALQKSYEELNEAWRKCGASHSILCRAIKRALGIKYWPIRIPTNW